MTSRDPMSIHISGLEAERALTLGHAERLEEQLHNQYDIAMALRGELLTVRQSRDNWQAIAIVTALVLLGVLVIVTVELCKMRF